MILGFFRRRPRLVTWPLLTSWRFEARHGLKEDMTCELIPTLPTSPMSLWHVNDMPPEIFVRSAKAHDLFYRALCFGTLCLLVSLLRVRVNGCAPLENKNLISSPRSCSSLTVTSLYSICRLIWTSTYKEYEIPLAFFLKIQIDSLVQDCSISSPLAMEILQSCTKPSKWSFPCGDLEHLAGRYKVHRWSVNDHLRMPKANFMNY